MRKVSFDISTKLFLGTLCAVAIAAPLATAAAIAEEETLKEKALAEFERAVAARRSEQVT